MRIAFFVNDLQLSGGVGVVIHHARQQTRHGHDVSLVLVREQDLPHWRYDALAGMHVASLGEAQDDHFDIAVATWWETTYSLFTVPAERYAYFVQSLEDRFYEPEMVERLGAAVTLDLPVAFITEARWIRDTLAELRPDAPCYLVRNGIDKSIFPAADTIEPRLRGPLRILIEGNPSVALKGIQDAVASVAAMRAPRHVTVVTTEHDAFAGGPIDRVIGPVPHREMAKVYAETDVVLKTSRVEGMFGPPLEGFHLGATSSSPRSRATRSTCSTAGTVSSPTGTTRAAPPGCSTGSRTIRASCTSCASTRSRRRSRGPTGSRRVSS